MNPGEVLEQVERNNPFVREMQDPEVRGWLAVLVEHIRQSTGLMPVAAAKLGTAKSRDSQPRTLQYKPNFLIIELNKKKPFRVMFRPLMKAIVKKEAPSMLRKPRGDNPRISIESEEELKTAMSLISQAASREGIFHQTNGHGGNGDSGAGRIVADDGICGGRPRIRGTRVRVVDVLEMLGSGMSEKEVLRDYPYLAKEDLSACLLYAGRFLDLPVLGASK